MGARHSPELWGENRQRSLAKASQLRSCPGSRTLLRTWQKTDGTHDLWELLSPVYKAGALRPCGLRKLYSGEVGDGDCGVEELDLLPLLALLGLLGLPFHLLDHLFSRQTETNNTLHCLSACLHGRKCLTWFAAFENHAIHFHLKSLHIWSDWLWMVLLLDTDFKWKLLLSICWIYIYRYKIWNFFKLANHFISVLKYGWMVTVFVSMGQGSVVPDVLSNTEADSWSSVAPGTDTDTLRTAHAARDSLTPRRPPGLCNKISTCKVPYFGTTLQFCLSHLY